MALHICLALKNNELILQLGCRLMQQHFSLPVASILWNTLTVNQEAVEQ